LMPHPPISLGIDSRVHLTRGTPPQSILATHRKWKKILRILVRMLLGNFAIVS
jgi:hypothetical protein